MWGHEENLVQKKISGKSSSAAYNSFKMEYIGDSFIMKPFYIYCYLLTVITYNHLSL